MVTSQWLSLFETQFSHLWTRSNDLMGLLWKWNEMVSIKMLFVPGARNPVRSRWSRKSTSWSAKGLSRKNTHGAGPEEKLGLEAWVPSRWPPHVLSPLPLIHLQLPCPLRFRWDTATNGPQGYIPLPTQTKRQTNTLVTVLNQERTRVVPAPVMCLRLSQSIIYWQGTIFYSNYAPKVSLRIEGGGIL